MDSFGIAYLNLSSSLQGRILRVVIIIFADTFKLLNYDSLLSSVVWCSAAQDAWENFELANKTKKKKNKPSK